MSILQKFNPILQTHNENCGEQEMIVRLENGSTIG